jgi:hypothetical protein
MKKLISTIMLALAVAGSTKAQTGAEQVARFSTETIQMGKLKQGQPTTATFTVTNVGKKDLIIEKATASCGCTSPDYTRAAIKPGQTGQVKATYNAAATGTFNKSVFVKFVGVADPVSLTIAGEVEVPRVATVN